jgi:hypothetical protein
MTRDELVSRTRQLIDEGDRLIAQPSLGAMQLWLQLSDDLLATAWGSMDRYHLAWLMVGKPKAIVRGRAMTPDEEAAYVREVATQKTAALRMFDSACRSSVRPVVGSGMAGPRRVRIPAWTGRQTGPACRPIRRWRIAWRRRVVGRRRTGTTGSVGHRDRIGCSVDGPVTR